jgi:beta-glucosidase
VCTDPRFGRTEENYGEDPMLVAALGVAALDGYQGNRAGPSAMVDYKHIVCEAKHYVAYAQGGFDGYTTDTSENTLRDIYLRPWRAFARNGGRAVMVSHNDVNNVPMHMNTELLTDVLRNEFGCQACLIGSDFHDVESLMTFQVAANLTDAAWLGLSAGVDQGLGDRAFSTATLRALLAAAPNVRSHLDRATANVLRAKFASGLFDRPITPADMLPLVGNGTALASRAVAEAAVLLKNNNRSLPLALSPASVAAREAMYGAENAPAGGVRSVALVGPLADDYLSYCGGYTHIGHLQPPLRALASAAARARVNITIETLLTEARKRCANKQTKQRETWHTMFSKANIQPKSGVGAPALPRRQCLRHRGADGVAPALRCTARHCAAALHCCPALPCAAAAAA